MSITNDNKKKLFEHFAIDQSLSPKVHSSTMHNKTDKLKNTDVPQKDSKQTPTNLANRRLGEAFFGDFGKPTTPSSEEFYYHREDDGSDTNVFVDNDGEVVYDPYVVMKN